MVYGFLGQGLVLQGHSSKGLMAEAGGQPRGEGQLQPNGATLGWIMVSASTQSELALAS